MKDKLTKMLEEHYLERILIMGAQSLNPDDFAQLKRIITTLAETRHLDVKSVMGNAARETEKQVLANTPHLCTVCKQSFDSCQSHPIFAIDKDVSLKGADADRVVECDAFKMMT